MFYLLLFLIIIPEHNNPIFVKTKQNKHKTRTTFMIQNNFKTVVKSSLITILSHNNT